MTAIYYPFLRAKTFDVIAVSNLAQQNGTFPGLGPVKRMSIKHHLELMNSII